MYQESVDKLKGSAKSDTLLFVLLIVFFFAAGGISTFLKMKFSSNIPLYIFVLIMGGLLYLYYRLRILGYRYTVFYKEPEPEYDERFGEYMIHEDYPYPVGTFVAERTASANGTVICIIKKDQLIGLLEPGASFQADKEIVCSPRSKEKSSSLVYNEEGKKVRVYFTPSEQLKEYILGIIDNDKASDL